LINNKTLKIALTGNPNSGKTTLFNAITGAHQHVGNYPGVTVEKICGFCTHNGVRLEIIDLPGTYSLTAVSEEELVTRDFILNEQPDVVVNVVDSSNIERNLFLAVQLLELGVPMILVLNMFDIASRNGVAVDPEKLSKTLNVPVVTTVGHKQKGISELLQTIVTFSAQKSVKTPSFVDYGPDVEQAVASIETHLNIPGPIGDHKRWFAVKILENDQAIIQNLQKIYSADHPLWSTIHQIRQRMLSLYGDTPEILIADRRYGYISGVWQETVKTGVEFRHDFSDQFDSVLTHPILGLPIFLGLMYLVFYLTFTLASPLTHGIELGVTLLSNFINGLWLAGSDSPLRSMIVEGIIGGVGGVIIFLPNIMFLFLAIAILEDTGYMARAAFIMDRFMHRIGLHGKSFIPMLIGFGCSVPAVMATRILENKRDRITTIMIIPLMSCGARLTIYSLFIPAFFPHHLQAPVLWMVYVIGIVLAAILARVLRVYLLHGENEGLVMELPPYRLPRTRGLLIHMWQRGWLYLQKAGTVILAFSIVLWALSTYPKMSKSELSKISDPIAQKTAELRYSAIGRIGNALEPIIKPIGFDWRIGTALVSALPAKEIFVSQISILFSVDDAHGHENPTLRQKLRQQYSPLTGFCVMLFTLISAPCLATIAVTRRETNSWLWAIAQFSGLTAIGYLITLIVFQVGSRIF